MWDFFQTVHYRHSVRHFRGDMAVEPEKLHAVLETACAAPSAGDLQSYRIIVVTAEAERRQLQAIAGGQVFIAEAPVALVFCADRERAAGKYGDRGRELYAVQDATIACTYAQLAIVAAGLGSTWIGAFDAGGIAGLLKLDRGLEPVAMLSVGYPAELPELSPRRPLNEVVEYR